MDLRRCIPWSIATLALAAVSGGLIHAFDLSGQLPPLFIALAVAFYLTIFLVFALEKGHCRNVWAAVALGLATAATFYGTFLLLGQRVHWGAVEPSGLGSYVEWRIEHQEFDNCGTLPCVRVVPDPESEGLEPPTPFWIGVGWVVLGLEIVGSLGLLLPFGIFWVLRKPYCEHCHRWAKRELVSFSAEVQDVVHAAQMGSLASVAEQSAYLYHPNHPSLLAAVEQCPGGLGGVCLGRDSVPAWISLKLDNGRRAFFDPFHPVESFFDRWALGPTALTRAALDVLRPLLPALNAEAGGQGEKTVSPLQAYWQSNDEGAAPGLLPRGEVAEIRSIDDDRGRVLLKAGDPAELDLVVLLLGAGAGVACFGFGLTQLAEDGPPSPAAIPLLLASVPLLLVSLGSFLRDSRWVSRRVQRRRVARVMEGRVDPWVDPADPEARFMAVVPQEHWGRAMAQEASDFGFLCFDPDRGLLLFEGLRERYRIPRRAVLGLAQDSYEIGAGQAAPERHFVLFHVIVPDGVVILSMSPEDLPWIPVMLRGYAWAHLRFCEELSEVLFEDSEHDLTHSVSPP